MGLLYSANQKSLHKNLIASRSFRNRDLSLASLILTEKGSGLVAVGGDG